MPTIAALATAPGPAGVAVVRVSGPEAHAIARRLCPALAASAEPRRMVLSPIVDPRSGATIDEGLVVLFEAGRSSTGEAVSEIHGHGGAANARALLEAVLAAGAEPAGRGAFTRRAVEHGRLDLARAEGIAELVAAASEASLAAARGLMGGALSARVEAFLGEVEALLAEWEATLDFPDDARDVDDGAWPSRLRGLLDAVRALAATHARGRRLRNGARVVLAGAPNAGKSSLMNGLAGYARALVDAAPGTTRDQVEARLELGGLAVTLVDGAGLREGGTRVEALGIARQRAAIADADLVLAVFDGAKAPGEDEAAVLRALEGAEGRTVAAFNKVDLGRAGHAALRARLGGAAGIVETSAATGEGVGALEARLGERLAGAKVGEDEVVVTLERHARALEDAGAALAEALARVEGEVGLDAAAEELRAARGALASVLGRGALAEEVLDRIFERFCIGK